MLGQFLGRRFLASDTDTRSSCCLSGGRGQLAHSGSILFGILLSLQLKCVTLLSSLSPPATVNPLATFLGHIFIHVAQDSKLPVFRRKSNSRVTWVYQHRSNHHSFNDVSRVLRHTYFGPFHTAPEGVKG